MQLLLDTHTLLWWLADDNRLSVTAREAIANLNHAVLVSSASVWEIATQHRLGKLEGVGHLLIEFEKTMQSQRFKTLPILPTHAILAGQFREPHRDPFDRMLAAQALIEDAQLISNDAAIAAFGVRLLW